MNVSIIAGRLTRDPIKRQTKEGTNVANFSVAVRRPGSKNDNVVTDFFDCVAWRATADFVEKWFHKGDGITVKGYMTFRNWEKDGVQHKSMEIVADEVEFPVGKGSGGGQAAAPADAAAAGGTPVEVTDDELPF